MLIRSQDKEILVNFNVLAGIEIEEVPVKTVIISCFAGCSYLLGKYSTKKKAMKVLDMIQEELQKKGFLAKLQDYEPVDFWGEDEK